MEVQQLRTPSSTQSDDNIFTLRSLNTIEKDLLLLPLVIDKKFRLYRAKALEYVFLRLKTNLNYYLRKRISAFKLNRTLQNLFLGVKAEGFYPMKPGYKTFREPLEMPFTRYIGLDSSKDFSSVGSEPLNYEIFQMYTSGSFLSKDPKDISRHQIEEIYRTQQLADVLNYVYKNIVHRAKLEGFNSLKAFMFTLSIQSIRSEKRGYASNGGESKKSVRSGFSSSQQQQNSRDYLQLKMENNSFEGPLGELEVLAEVYEGKDANIVDERQKMTDNLTRQSRRRIRNIDVSQNYSFGEKEEEWLGLENKKKKNSGHAFGFAVSSGREDAENIETRIKNNEESQMFDESYSFSIANKTTPAGLYAIKGGLDYSNFMFDQSANALNHSALTHPQRRQESSYVLRVPDSAISKDRREIDDAGRLSELLSSFDLLKWRNTSKESLIISLRLTILVKIIRSKILRDVGLCFEALRIHGPQISALGRSPNQERNDDFSLITPKPKRGFQGVSSIQFDSLLREMNALSTERDMKLTGIRSMVLGLESVVEGAVFQFKLAGFEHIKARSVFVEETNRLRSNALLKLDTLTNRILMRSSMTRIRETIRIKTLRRYEDLFNRLECLITTNSLQTGTNVLKEAYSQSLIPRNKSISINDTSLDNYTRPGGQTQEPKNNRVNEVRSHGEGSTINSLSELRSLQANRNRDALKSQGTKLIVARVASIRSKKIRISFGRLFEHKIRSRERQIKLQMLCNIVETLLDINQLDAKAEGFTVIKDYTSKIAEEERLLRLSSMKDLECSYMLSEGTLSSSVLTVSEQSVEQVEEEEEEETGVGYRQSLDVRKLLAMKTMYNVMVNGRLRMLRSFEEAFFAKVKVHVNQVKLIEAQQRLEMNTWMSEKEESSDAEEQRINALAIKIQDFYKRVATKMKGYGFNMLLKHLYVHRNAQIRRDENVMMNFERVMENLVKTLSMRVKLQTHCEKVQAFYNLKEKGKQEINYDMNAGRSVEEAAAAVQPLLQTVKSIYKVHRMRWLIGAFGLLKENKKHEDEGLDIMKLKIIKIFGRMIEVKADRIVQLKAWEKLKEYVEKGESPKLRQERRKLKERDLKYFVRVIGLIKKFSRKEGLLWAMNQLKDTWKVGKISTLSEKITEDMQRQIEKQQIQRGFAYIEKVVYYSEKRSQMHAFRHIREYGKAMRDRYIKQIIGVKNLVKCLHRRHIKENISPFMYTLIRSVTYLCRETIKMIAEKSKRSSTINQTLDQIAQNDSNSHEFRRKVYKEIKRKLSQNKATKLTQPIHLLTSYHSINSADEFPSQDRENTSRESFKSDEYSSNSATNKPTSTKVNISRLPININPSIPAKFKINIQHSHSPPIENSSQVSQYHIEGTSGFENKVELTNVSIETPTLQPSIERMNPSYTALPLSHRETLNEKIDMSYATINKDTTNRGHSATSRTYSISTLPKHTGPRKVSWQSNYTRLSHHDGHHIDHIRLSTNSNEEERRTIGASARSVKYKENSITQNSEPDKVTESSEFCNLANFSFKPEGKPLSLRLDSEENFYASNNITYGKSLDRSAEYRLSTIEPVTDPTEPKEYSRDSSAIMKSIYLLGDKTSYPMPPTQELRSANTLTKPYSRYTEMQNDEPREHRTHRQRSSVPMEDANIPESERYRTSTANTARYKSPLQSYRLRQSQGSDKGRSVEMSRGYDFDKRPTIKERYLIPRASEVEKENRAQYSFDAQAMSQNASRDLRRMNSDSLHNECECCDLCGKEFQTEEEYTVYKASHSGKKEKIDVKECISPLSLGAKEIQMRMLQRITRQKLDYLHYEKRKVVEDITNSIIESNYY